MFTVGNAAGALILESWEGTYSQK